MMTQPTQKQSILSSPFFLLAFAILKQLAFLSRHLSQDSATTIYLHKLAIFSYFQIIPNPSKENRASFFSKTPTKLSSLSTFFEAPGKPHEFNNGQKNGQ